MRNDTRAKFKAFLNRVSEVNGGADVSTKFAATPSVEQTLEQRIQENSAFLQQVNHVPTEQQSGEKVGLLVTSTIAGRTDTSGGIKRVPVDVSDTDPNTYKCEQTNFDTSLRYAKLDMWAKFPNFQTMIRDTIIRQQALDRIMIGWNGTSVAATTDRGVNQLLQDVNIGWMKKLQTEAAARYMTQGAAVGEVRVGPGSAIAGYGDYANLDALVHDMRSNLLEPWYSRDTTFTAICSGDLLDEKYFPIIANHAETPSETGALDLMLSNKKLGGLRPAEVPYFQARSIMVTRTSSNGDSNLSTYYQEGSRRRHIKDEPELDRIANYESVNEAYVIEDVGAACAAVNIKLWDPVALAWY